MRVLIVEDDPDVAESVSLCLQLRGIEAAKSESYDVAILDINLPDIDGFEVLKRIRRFSNVPTIIVSVRGRISFNPS